MDLHLILRKRPSCSLVLVRPWMQELHAIQDWSMIKLSPSKGFNTFYDLHLQRVIKCRKEKETSIDNGKQDEEIITMMDLPGIGKRNCTTWYVRMKEKSLKKVLSP